MIAEIATHVWQSTAVTIAIGLLTLVFRANRAKVRFALWLSASLKFFVPFTFLMSLGSHIRLTPAVHETASRYATPAIVFAVDSVAEPFGVSAAPNPIDWAPIAFLALWTAGFVAVTVIRIRQWLRVRRALRASSAMEISAPVEIRSAPGLLDPGVVGIWKPVLLLPEGIADRLTSTELEAVLAHELCHVRRRDNLLATIHMLVEAVFWFHPFVWWIGAQLIEERERACDEEVLSLGNQPRVYADAILGVCRLYAESPLACVSGVSGSNTRRRIEAIMTNRRGRALNRGKKALLAIAGGLALGGPVIVGVLISFGQLPEIHAQASVVLPPAFVAQAQPTPALPTVDAPLRRDRGMIVMLFDFAGMAADQEYRAKLNASLYVDNQMKPGDLVSVMAVDSGSIRVMHDFTGDSAELKSVIKSIRSDPAATTDESAVIESLAGMVRAFPEKKTLLLFSNRNIQAGAENRAAVKHAIDMATEANLAIVPIDMEIAAITGGRGGANALTFGAKSPMARAFVRYGAPDQTEDRATSQIWRYNYLEDYHGGAAFEFSKDGFSGGRILYPQPEATFEGSATDVAQLAPLTGGLRGGADASKITPDFPNQHPSLQVYRVAPGTAPSPDRRYVPISIPLDSLSGTVDIVSQIRVRTDNQQPGEIVANLADSPQASSGGYHAAFTLRPGAYVCKVLVREASTGRMFGEVVNFEVK
jgi:beta-lactamase regulating signal transducer with metallopeptidase domain